MDSAINDYTIDYIISETDKDYRKEFTGLIKETKLKTHQCQYECYKSDSNDLSILEECARKCFKPLLYIKKNVSTLIENHKENLEKCRVGVRSKYNDARTINMEIERCIENYKKALNSSKDEVEFIYKGYMKNL
jgi:ribosome-binding ATPase YchF (GTP1/OBG family)